MFTVPASQSAAALLRSSIAAPRFSSGSAAIDDLFTPASHPSSPSSSQGLAHGAVLELMGPSGIGKTRAALGFILAARFDALGDTAAEEVLVVDTEGSLSPELMESTAVLYAAHNSLPPAAARQVCEGIHYRRICEVSLLVAFFHTLPMWLNQHPKVKLIVLDSLTAHFRPSMHDYQTRSMLFNLVKTTLTQVTSVQSVSVVVTTQLSLKLFSPTGEPSAFSSDAEALLVPQLGDSWIGGQCWRVVLFYDTSGERLAQLVSSPVPTRGMRAAFTMDALGPCDYPTDNTPNTETSPASSMSNF